MIATTYTPRDAHPRIERWTEPWECRVYAYRIEEAGTPTSPCKSDQGIDVSPNAVYINQISIPTEKGLIEEFNERADRWTTQTGMLSSPTKRILHEDYQSIMARGEPVIPLILNRLKHDPDDWFWALKHLSKHDAAKDIVDFSEAVKAWLDWGRKKRLIN